MSTLVFGSDRSMTTRPSPSAPRRKSTPRRVRRCAPTERRVSRGRRRRLGGGGVAASRRRRFRARGAERRRVGGATQRHQDALAVDTDRMGQRTLEIQHHARATRGLHDVDGAQVALVELDQIASDGIDRARKVERDARRIGDREAGRHALHRVLHVDGQHDSGRCLRGVDTLDRVVDVGRRRLRSGDGGIGGQAGDCQLRQRLDKTFDRHAHRLLPCRAAASCSSSLAGRSTHSPAASWTISLRSTSVSEILVTSPKFWPM